MSPKRDTVLTQDVEKDFAYYVFRVRKATSLYDKAIESDTTEHENGMAMINMPALEKCQEISLELLGDIELPPEHRILLNYYMAAQQDKHLSILYLKSALEVVEMLEIVDRAVDPMREILETQLNDALSRAYPPRSPERITAHNNRFLDCFPRNYSAPPILRQKSISFPLPSLRSGTMRGEFTSYGRGRGFPTPSDAQAQSADISPSSCGPETVLERHLSDGRHSPGPVRVEAEHTESYMPSTGLVTAQKRHLGDGLVFDATSVAQSTSSPHDLNIAGITQDQPSIVVTNADSPDSRPTIIHKIQCATARRQIEMIERYAEGEGH